MRMLRAIGCVALTAAIGAQAASAKDLAGGLKKGTPDLKSIGPITFGPDALLFVSDPISASIFAIQTGDTTASEGDLNVPDIKNKVAGLLGATARQVTINDLAVNPATGNAFLSVTRGQGAEAKPVLLRVHRSGDISEFALKDVMFAKAALPDAPDAQAKDRRGGSLRQEAITDLAFVNGRLFVAGLSNEEFASRLRAIPFPFNEVEKGAGIRIFHGAHGRFETEAPVRTFAPYTIGGKLHLLASYTCTPLVKFDVDDLKAGAKVEGVTIAELGNRNRPLDMITYEKDGKPFVLLANNSRGVMKIKADGIESAEKITEPVRDGNTKGLPYDTIAELKGVVQLDKIDAEKALVLIESEGASELKTVALP